MQNILFKDNQHRDTSFFVDEKGLRQSSLFGHPMETSAALIGRVTGIFDVFCSLGVADGGVITRCEQNGDHFYYQTQLFGGALQYTSCLEYFRPLGIFKRKDSLKNLSAQAITLYKAAARWILAFDEFEAYTQNTRWCIENIGGWNPVSFGGLHLACEGGRTTQGATPFLALRNKQNQGFALHVVPVGNWQIQLQTVSLGISQAGEYAYVLEAGPKTNHFAMLLSPDESYELPEMLLQNLQEGDLSKSAAQLQKYFLLQDNSRFEKSHPVVYNPWFEQYANLDLARLTQHLETAQQLGCEVFEIDAGWYGSGEGDWWAQAGNWEECQISGFYGKMNEFIEGVHQKGMKFGLWMEPERIGPKAPIYLQHPEYFSQGGSGFFYPKLWQPAVYTYMLDTITELIHRYSLAWMKMDFNYELGEDCSGTEFYLYYKAWYRLLGEVRTRCPNTFLEACAAGGQRTDINTCTVYDGHFLSDNVNSWDMLAVYAQGCLRLPHYRLIKWLVLSPGVDVAMYNAVDGAKTSTVITTQKPGAGWDEYEKISPEFACQLTMCGMVGLSGDFIGLHPEQKQVVAQYVDFYKKVRGFFKESTLHMSRDPFNVGDREGFFHLQYQHVSQGKNLLYTYRFITARAEDRLYLKGLCPEKTYVITEALSQQELGRYSGEELMYRGYPLVYTSRNSGKIFWVNEE